MKKSFLIHYDNEEIIKALTDEQAGQLFKAFFDYNVHGEKPNLEKSLYLLWLMFKQRFDNDNNKYQDVCQKRKENVQKRWEKEKTKTNQNKQMNTNEYKCIQTDTKHTDKDKEKDKDKDKDTLLSNDSGSNTHVSFFIPPTLNDVLKVCKAYEIDEKVGTKFFNFYKANGWIQGKNKPIQDWVAQLNVWVSEQYQFEKPTTNGKPAKYKEREYSDSEFDALFEKDLKSIEL